MSGSNELYHGGGAEKPESYIIQLSKMLCQQRMQENALAKFQAKIKSIRNRPATSVLSFP